MQRNVLHYSTHLEVEERVEFPKQPQSRPFGSETWQSGEQDTSQVSVSSLPEDERSEEPVTERTVTTDEQITSTQVTTHVTTDESVDIRVEHKGMY